MFKKYLSGCRQILGNRIADIKVNDTISLNSKSDIGIPSNLFIFK